MIYYHGKKLKKTTFNHNAATMVKKAESYIQAAPEEHREPENLTGIPNEELFGPSFLYEEPMIWTEKKITSACSVVYKQQTNYSSQSESEIESSSSEIDDQVKCMIYGKGVLANKEQEHINAEHPDEE